MTAIDDETRLRHMLDAAHDAVSFIQGKAKADLEQDRMLQFAVVRAIEIVGEAATNISSSLQAQHPEIAWRQVIGTRNQVVHAYFRVDLDILWQILIADLPVLIAQLEAILRSKGIEPS